MESTKPRTRLTGIAAAIVCACLAFTLTACGTSGVSSSEASSSASSSAASSQSASSSAELPSVTAGTAPDKADITIDETIENSADGEHAIEADGTTDSYSNVEVVKTGDSDSGDEADFYGDNATIFATNGATLNLSNIVVESDGTHANGVFSYGEGTTVNISDSVIETEGNCSGGLMTTGGGTMNASNLRVLTSGNSSAAIRSDRGGGTVNVDGGVYATSGTGSPVIYSTADITVSNAYLESTASQGVVVEGKNSVTLNDDTVVADNNTKNSDKSDVYQAVMIYQSMSGDAANGEASFTMNGGSLTNANGDVFFVNNTVATITLNKASIVNNGDGAFLRAAAAGWGNEGSNGGQVTLKATAQTIDGDMVVDDVSNLNLYLADASTFTGAINSDGEAGDVYVELAGGSKWVLTADSYITSLTCDADSIDLNGHTLYVDGQAYSAGTASTGTAIEVVVSESTGNGPGGEPPSGGAPSSGSAPSGGAPSSGGTPPDKPSGSSSSSKPN
ncbi:MAG: hypothetical protein IJ111_11540 [Eggerthellaceae bacterium]|nr:hypothetical protein [Eggerthellaceae bacterium]